MEYEASVIEYIKREELDKLIPFSNNYEEESTYFAVTQNEGEPYPPEWNDLVELHKKLRERKVIKMLEVGIGYSSIIAADALKKNSAEQLEFVKENIRQDDPFNVTSVDDSDHYINKCIENTPSELKEFIKPHFSKTQMGTFNDRVCTYFETFPNICPDFILLDGPSQFNIEGDIRGIHTRETHRVIMGGDLLAIEHFFLPGTMIMSDGKTSNIRFLQYNFQRNWEYSFDEKYNIHYLELKEKALGKLNQKQLDYCLGPEWSKF